MNRVVLPATIAFASYVTSFVPPDPGLMRIAPDRAMPRQTPLSVGFWGASAEVWLIGPEYSTLYGKRPVSVPVSYPVTVNFDSVLRYDRPDLLSEAKEPRRRGFLRMVPSMWYGVRSDVPGRFVPDGREACSGRFFWFPPRRPTVPVGWRVLSQRKVRIDLDLTYPNPAYAGGGVEVVIHEPKGWSLKDIGLTRDVRYVVYFQPATDSPYSIWRGPKPTALKDIIGPYEMDPRVLAEVVETVVENPSTAERRTMRTPTGWVEAAGRFRRIDGSGWPQSPTPSPVPSG